MQEPPLLKGKKKKKGPGSRPRLEYRQEQAGSLAGSWSSCSPPLPTSLGAQPLPGLLPTLPTTFQGLLQLGLPGTGHAER